MDKRNLFAELSEGIAALKAEHEGKLTLRRVNQSSYDPLVITPEEIRAMREKANMSQGVMAQLLRVNPRTWQNWEQGKAKPNAQAAILMRLTEKYPETIALLAKL